MSDFPLRSCLFIPATRWDFISKARRISPDAVFLDLEDSIPLGAEKVRARASIARAIENLSGLRTFVRINDRESGLDEQDIMAAVSAGSDGLVVPKVSSAQDVERVDALIDSSGPEAAEMSIVVLIETAASLLRLDEIAGSSPRLIALALGSEDLFADLHLSPMDAQSALAGPRGSVVIAARAHGHTPIDTVYTNFTDVEGLRASLSSARDIGMAGMLALHPSQIPVANAVFSPTGEEVAWADRVVQQVEQLSGTRQGVGVLDGEFVGPPILRRAEQILAWSAAVQGDAGSE